MNLIWSGLKKEDTLVGDEEVYMTSKITFSNVSGSKSKEIYQTETEKIINSETRKVISKNTTKKEFRWSLQDFKFIEVKGK